MRAASITLLLLAGISATPAWSQDQPAPAASDGKVPLEGDEAQQTFPDWSALRASALEKGIGVRIGLTSFGEKLLAGDGDNGTDFVGKGDLFINLDGSKLGLWKGSGLSLHGEANVGDLDLLTPGAGECICGLVVRVLGFEEAECFSIEADQCGDDFGVEVTRSLHLLESSLDQLRGNSTDGADQDIVAGFVS